MPEAAGVLLALLCTGAIGAYYYLRGEKVGNVRGTANDLDPMGRMRVEIARRTGADGVTPRVDIKVVGMGFVKVFELTAEEAEELARGFDEAAASARA